MGALRRGCFVLVAWLTVGVPVVVAQQLVPATEPRLVNCNDKPCFRIAVNAVDAAGRAMPLDVPGAGSQHGFEVNDAGERYKVFYVSAIDDPSAPRRGTYWMLLLDMSGSMLSKLGDGTRLDAAREAIRGAVADIREGQDHFSLVPFESHRVRAGVQSAQFVSSAAEALQQLGVLRPPPPSNNTALYTAVFEALDVLRRFEQQGNDVSLVVFTDGKNDVHPERGDDPGLFGPEGLELVKQRAREFNIQIKTIGFGARGDSNFDEPALKQLAWPDERHYAYARDAEGVRGILASNARALATRVNLTFGPVRETKGQLRGRTLGFSIVAAGGARAVQTASPAVWSAPAIQEPSFVDVLNAAEQKAFDGENLLDFPNRWIPRLTALGIFSTVLIAGWFGLPRLVWPESYIPKPNFPIPEARPQAGASMGGGTRGSPNRSQASRPDVRPRPPAREAPRSEDSPSAVSRPAPRPSQPRRPAPPRDPGDTTVYIPRGKKFEKDS